MDCYALKNNPYIKTRNLFSTTEQVSQLRSDLEKASEQKFKEIDEAKRKTLVEARNIRLDSLVNQS